MNEESNQKIDPEEFAEVMRHIVQKKEGVHKCQRCDRLEERPVVIGAAFMFGIDFENLLICSACQHLQYTNSKVFFREGWDPIKPIGYKEAI